MIQNEREIRHEHVLEAVRQMMTAARTAPKGKGIDIIEIAMVTGEDIQRLSDEMLNLAAETGFKFILRDADNILSAEAIVILGTRQQAQGLNCAHCGFETCVEAGRSTVCHQFCRFGYCYRFGLCNRIRFASGYPCYVQCRSGSPTFGMAGREQECDGHSGQRLF